MDIDKERAAFEVWAKSEGLIQESHGLRSVNSMCDMALKAWRAGRAALASQGEPFMFGIMGPDGKAHMDENCVSEDEGHLEYEVECLNEAQEGDYSVVPLYTAPPAAVPAPICDACNGEGMVQVELNEIQACRKCQDVDDDAAPAQANAWEEAVKDACTVAGELGWNEADPRASLNKLIEWHIQVALDPRVSDRAPAQAVDALPVLPGCLADRLFEAISMARDSAENDGSNGRIRKWEATAADLRAALAAQPAAPVHAKPDASAGCLSALLTEVSDVLAENNWRGDLVEALREAARPTTEQAPAGEPVAGCHCEACDPNTFLNQRMILCAKCGNKRCPHATNHRNACTNSNEPGQKGSSWENYSIPVSTGKTAATACSACYGSGTDVAGNPCPCGCLPRVLAAPVANAGQAQAVAVPWTKDAEEWGAALNDAGWEFFMHDKDVGGKIFNHIKPSLRAAILKYAEKVAAAPLPQQVAQTEDQPHDYIPRRARKVGGSYQADGTIIADFITLTTGARRFVFEFDNPAGMLHIFNEDQLELEGE